MARRKTRLFKHVTITLWAGLLFSSLTCFSNGTGTLGTFPVFDGGLLTSGGGLTFPAAVVPLFPGL